MISEEIEVINTNSVQNNTLISSLSRAEYSIKENKRLELENLRQEVESLKKDVYGGTVEEKAAIPVNMPLQSEFKNNGDNAGAKIKAAASAMAGFVAGYVAGEIQKNSEADKKADIDLKTTPVAVKQQSGSIQLTGNLAITPKIVKFAGEGALSAASIGAASFITQPSLIINNGSAVLEMTGNSPCSTGHLDGAATLTGMFGLAQMFIGFTGLENNLTNRMISKKGKYENSLLVNVGDIVRGAGVFGTIFSPVGLPVAIAGAGMSTIGCIIDIVRK